MTAAGPASMDAEPALAARPERTPGAEPGLLRRLVRRPGGRAGLLGAALFVALAAVAPIATPHDPTKAGGLPPLLPPSFEHPFGTDGNGIDVLSRLVRGAPLSLGVAALATAVAVTLGTLVGAVAGTARGLVDSLLMRLTDLFLAVPRVVLLIALAAFVRGSAGLLVVILGLTGWMGTARIVRAEALSIRERDYVLAARSLGASAAAILFHHVLPNVLTPVLVSATLGLGNTLLLEASLSYLGFGPPIEVPSWGNLVRHGKEVLDHGWWVATFPGLAIALAVTSFTLVGDELRAVLDPRAHAGETR